MEKRVLARLQFQKIDEVNYLPTPPIHPPSGDLGGSIHVSITFCAAFWISSGEAESLGQLLPRATVISHIPSSTEYKLDFYQVDF